MGRRWSAEDKARGLAAVAEVGSTPQAERMTGIPDETLRGWRWEANVVRKAAGLPPLPSAPNAMVNAPQIPPDWAPLMARAGEIYAETATIAGERLRAELAVAPATETWRDRQSLAVIMGIAGDKFRDIAAPRYGTGGSITIDARRQTILASLSDEQVARLAALTLDDAAGVAVPAEVVGAVGARRTRARRAGEERGGSPPRRSNTSQRRNGVRRPKRP